MRKLWIPFAVAALVLLAVGVSPGWALADEGDTSGADPKVLFVDTHKCNMCHAVPAAGIEAKAKSEKMKGPELGGKIEAELEKIAAYMRKEADLDGKQHKKAFKGTDEELQAILDWLGSLEASE